MDYGVGPWKMAFSHGLTFTILLLLLFIIIFQTMYKVFGSPPRCKPNVDQEEWSCTKTECVDLCVVCSKMAVLKKKNKIEFDHSLCLVLSSSSLPQKKFIKNWVKHLPEDVFGLSHHNTSWTMSVNNVRHKIWLLGTLNSMVTLIFFLLVYTEVVTGWVQQPITDFTRPSDDFMVHGVNNP